MTDYISRADAVKAIRKCKFESVMPSGWYRGMEDAMHIVETLPPADAVSREKYDTVCEEYNRLVHNAICIKLCDENCEYEKGKTCYHAREHSAVDGFLSADAVQGEWTYLSGSKGSYMTISCPICGSTFDGVAEWKYHYCPSCGAYMGKKGGAE